MSCVEDAANLAPHFCPISTLRAAHQLLQKWDVLEERMQLWAELQAAMSVLGKATAWELPAQLRLVGVVVQVVDALADKTLPAAAAAAIHRWIASLKSQQLRGKMDHLGLLQEFGFCMQCEGPADSADTAISDLADLEAQVLDAARTLSPHFEAQVLDKALVSALVSKDYDVCQKLLDELKLLQKFRAASEAPPEGGGVTCETPNRSVSSSRDCFTAVAERSPGSFGMDTAMEAMRSDDVEDTLEAMMELGSASLLPQSELSTVSVAVAHQGGSEKRKREMLNEELKDDRPFHPKRQMLVTQTPMFSSRNALFDDPISPESTDRPGDHNAIASDALFSAPIRSSGYLGESTSSSRVLDRNARSEVPEGQRTRISWTTEEEQRLIEGHEKYGRRWEQIRASCGLKHRLGTQIRDKWENLVKSGRACNK